MKRFSKIDPLPFFVSGTCVLNVMFFLSLVMTNLLIFFPGISLFLSFVFYNFSQMLYITPSAYSGFYPGIYSQLEMPRISNRRLLSMWRSSGSILSFPLECLSSRLNLWGISVSCINKLILLVTTQSCERVRITLRNSVFEAISCL